MTQVTDKNNEETLILSEDLTDLSNMSEENLILADDTSSNLTKSNDDLILSGNNTSESDSLITFDDNGVNKPSLNEPIESVIEEEEILLKEDIVDLGILDLSANEPSSITEDINDDLTVDDSLTETISSDDPISSSILDEPLMEEMLTNEPLEKVQDPQVGTMSDILDEALFKFSIRSDAVDSDILSNKSEILEVEKQQKQLEAKNNSLKEKDKALKNELFEINKNKTAIEKMKEGNSGSIKKKVA